MNPYPINQVFLGDSVLSNPNLDSQIQFLKNYEERLKSLKDTSENSIWNKIDNEINTLTDEQKHKLFEKQEYIELNAQLQNKVQMELLCLVKSKIENSEDGNSLLKSLFETIKKQKKEIIEESNKELELFNKFREFSKNNPSVTYEQFIKMNM